MRRIYKASAAKFPDKDYRNEDSVLAEQGRLAISDGAGGCGLYADEWSKYLLEKLPQEPIVSFDGLNGWLDGIWEDFYNRHEQLAKEQDGLFLKKFYEEGSCATLAAAWEAADVWHWAAYGDSVVFHYNRETKELEHSFTELADFSHLPFLIDFNELRAESFRCGSFTTDASSVVFVASDALSHYLLSAYLLGDREKNAEELERASHGENAGFVAAIERLPKGDYYETTLRPLLQAAEDGQTFRKYMDELYEAQLIDRDDYSLAAIDLSDRQTD